MVAHFFNPSYSGGAEQEDCSLRLSQAKSLRAPISANNKLGMVPHACHPSYTGSINSRVMVQASPCMKRDLVPKITKPKRMAL
jgi:hypothetical protein